MAQHGLRVQLFERERFPRFHIGESLIPETFWVLKRLGMIDKMRKYPFVKKYSVQFVTQHGKLSEPFYFMENKPHESSQTWQVLRSEFDQMMLDNAREHGVAVHEGVRVLDVLFEGERAVGVKVQEEDGREREVRAGVVVDASGQSGLISSRFKLRVIDPVLNKNVAIWTYWEGAYRDTGRDEGATLVLQTKDKEGWFWYIPLHNNIISVGVVAPHEYLFRDRGASHEQIYFEQVERCPGVEQRIASARRASGFHCLRDYSYRASRCSGEGWVMVGDAYGFLDPLYSSGVLLALKSGSMAGDAVAEGLAKGDTSQAQLGKWEDEFCRGMDRMRRLVCEYYDGFSFGRFVKRFPQYKGTLTDILIGDLFRDEVDEVWDKMEMVRAETRAATE
jgi:flavin-dependent dehydrogenase